MKAKEFSSQRAKYLKWNQNGKQAKPGFREHAERIQLNEVLLAKENSFGESIRLLGLSVRCSKLLAIDWEVKLCEWLGIGQRERLKSTGIKYKWNQEYYGYYVLYVT